jgi:hypothetical protein
MTDEKNTLWGESVPGRIERLRAKAIAEIDGELWFPFYTTCEELRTCPRGATLRRNIEKALPGAVKKVTRNLGARRGSTVAVSVRGLEWLMEHAPSDYVSEWLGEPQEQPKTWPPLGELPFPKRDEDADDENE